MAKTPPELQAYKKQEDSPYVAHARSLMETGYKGLNEYTPKVNTMNETTQADIEGRLGNIYNRANSDFEKSYRDNMMSTMANQYGKFGTNNNTSSLYANDEVNKQAQRKLADLAYNKAENYESDVDRELARRYKTIDMYNKEYGYGAIPQKYDDQNYKLDNVNQDRRYQNDFNQWKTDQATQKTMTNMALNAIELALAVPTGGTSLLVGGAINDSVGGLMNPNTDATYTGGQTGWGSVYGDSSGNSSYGGFGSGTKIDPQDMSNLLSGSKFGQDIILNNKNQNGGGKTLADLLGGNKEGGSQEQMLMELLKKLFGGGGSTGGGFNPSYSGYSSPFGGNI